MSNRITHKFFPFIILALCVLSAGFMSACSRSASPADGGSEISPSSSGGISFRLVWQRTHASGARAQFTPPFNACIDHAIDTIAATVSDGTSTVASGSWPCSAHEGIILGVPAGTNFTVTVDGITSGLTTWSGLATAITVTNEIADAGTIVMTYAGTDFIPPTVTSIGPASDPSATTNIPVTDRVLIAFSEPMAISTVTATSITLINSSDTSTVSGVVSYVTASSSAAFIPSANLAYGTQYIIQMSSAMTDVAGNLLASDYTNTFTTEPAPADAPAAPGGVTALAGNGQVTVDWLAANGAVSYNVYYLTSSPVTTTTGTPLADVRAPFVHIGLTNSQTYYYLVTAVNSTAETPAATEVSATPAVSTGNPNVPAPPASLTTTPGSGQNIVSWPTVTNATTYNIYWSTTPITPDKNAADNVIRDASSPFTHAGLAPGQTYYYIVTAANSFGESSESVQATAAPGP